MNQLTTPHVPISAKARGSLATTLANIEAAYILPTAEVPGASRYKAFNHLLDNDGTPRERWRAFKRAMELAPTPEDLQAYIDAVAPALETPPDAKKARVMVGMLLAAYPSGRPADPDAYAETVLHDVLSLGFSPHVLAQACQTVRREVKFLPSVAEVVEACKAAKDQLASSHRFAGFLKDRIAKARAYAELPEPALLDWELAAHRREAEHREQMAANRPARDEGRNPEVLSPAP